MNLIHFYHAFRAFPCRNTWNALISSRSFHPWFHPARGLSPRRNSAIQTREKIHFPILIHSDWWRVNKQRKNYITIIGQEIHKKMKKKISTKKIPRRTNEKIHFPILIHSDWWRVNKQRKNYITFAGQEIHKKMKKRFPRRKFREEVRRRFRFGFWRVLIDESQRTNQITFNGQRRFTYQQNNSQKKQSRIRGIHRDTCGWQ